MNTIYRYFRFYLLALMLFLSICQTSCFENAIQNKRNKGTEIIRKIEAFKFNKDRLPISLSEIGIAESEEGPIYYKQIDESHYQLWYGTTLGESVTYDSKRETWQ